MFYRLFSMGLDKTIGIIDSITDNDIFDSVRNELVFHLYATIHFFGDVSERLNKNDLSQEELGYIYAFEYINNNAKHNQSVDVVYYEVYSNRLPTRLPFRLGPPGILWKEFSDPGIRGDELKKRKKYLELLVNNDVKETLLVLRDLVAKRIL